VRGDADAAATDRSQDDSAGHSAYYGSDAAQDDAVTSRCRRR